MPNVWTGASARSQLGALSSCALLRSKSSCQVFKILSSFNFFFKKKIHTQSRCKPTCQSSASSSPVWHHRPDDHPLYPPRLLRLAEYLYLVFKKRWRMRFAKSLTLLLKSRVVDAVWLSIHGLSTAVLQVIWISLIYQESRREKYATETNWGEPSSAFLTICGPWWSKVAWSLCQRRFSIGL